MLKSHKKGEEKSNRRSLRQQPQHALDCPFRSLVTTTYTHTHKIKKKERKPKQDKLLEIKLVFIHPTHRIKVDVFAAVLLIITTKESPISRLEAVVP